MKVEFAFEQKHSLTGYRFRRDEEREPGEDDEDDGGDVRLHNVVADLAVQVDLHDDARVGQVVVVGRVGVLELDLVRKSVMNLL